MTLHERIREATRTAHRQLDHHPLLAPLVHDGLTLEQYSRSLVALHGIYAAIESAVEDTALAAGFDYAARRKVPAMEADLAALQCSPRPSAIRIAPPRSNSELIGRLYPLEGSTLGAAVICRQVRAGPGGSWPLHYFSGYGDATMERWQAFWRFADTACPGTEIDVACATAVATFEAIKQHLDDALQYE